MDFIIGISIFTVAMIIYYTFMPNLQRQEFDYVNQVYLDGRSIADSLALEGYPVNWTLADAQRIGLVTGRNMLNRTKVENFKNFSVEDYPRTKRLLSVRSDYAVYFFSLNGTNLNISNISMIGKAEAGVSETGIDSSLVEAGTLARFERILSFEGRPVVMEVYTWQ